MPFFLHDGRIHVFLHVPKAAGTTIEDALSRRFGPLGLFHPPHFSAPPRLRWSRTSPQHVTADDLLKLVPREMIASSFAVVRHPVDRVISAYHHLNGYQRLPVGLSLEAWFRHYAALAPSHPFAFDNHLRPQTDFLLDDTKVFRLEDGLAPVLDHVEATFGPVPAGGPAPADEPDAPHLNAAREADPRGAELDDQSLTPAFLAELRAFYAAEFDRFAYDIPAGKAWSYRRPRLSAGARPIARLALYRAGVATRRLAAGGSPRTPKLLLRAGAQLW
ncbi:MAG: sulfotransferase family 2 domain-containing protein [Pseudomonadota bacterium]